MENLTLVRTALHHVTGRLYVIGIFNPKVDNRNVMFDFIIQPERRDVIANNGIIADISP